MTPRRADPILIFAHNPGPLTGSGNNTWLIDGSEPTLVDAGVGATAHLEAIANALRERPLARVLVTHGHRDHASGVPALRERWPALEVGQWPELRDGDVVRAGDSTLTAIHTPGHAPDHICFWDPARRDLFGGDMVVKGTTIMIPAGRGGNLRDYLSSLDRLAALEPRRIFPGHGPVIDDPVTLIREYIEHRHLRESQVQAALDAGIVDVDAIVSRIYPDLAEALRPAARLTVEAHLEKLRDDGN
jgi:glyoxylase-like metal-dependent hydrolase (beta-lactamase superfamily II)